MVIELPRDEAALTAAVEIAEISEARLSTSVVAVHPGSEFSAMQLPLSDVLEDIGRGSRSHAGWVREQIAAWLSQREVGGEVRHLTIEDAAGRNEIVAHARVVDLVVTSAASRKDVARHALFEDVLFKSGRPLLIVPGAARPRRWEKFVIGWNASAEAVHAVAGAMPLLRNAKQVVVATVDAQPSSSRHSEGPGHEIATHLARHGVAVEVSNLDGMGRTHARVLLDLGVDVDADLLVLGAYGRSRAEEFVFGGVTRDLLDYAPMPLLLAH